MRELESTPWPDVQDLLSYWRVSPPVHVLVKAGFFEEEDSGHIPTEEELASAIRDFNRE